MVLVEKSKCKIDSLTDKGLGLGKTDMGEVELAFMLPRDEVEFERHSYRGKSNCLYISHKEGSHPRQKPECEYFGICGGCLLQHLTQDDYDDLKLNMAIKSLKAEGIEDYQLNPMITVPKGNRRRANLEAVNRKGEIIMGFHKFRAHIIRDIDKCVAMKDSLSNLILPFKEVLVEVLEERERAQVFLTEADNGIDISLEIQNRKELEENKRKLLSDFAIKAGLTRFSFRYRKTTDVIHEKEAPYIEFGGVRVDVDAYCFLQSSKESDRILGELVLKYIGEDHKKGVDLFCGRGTYTLPLARAFEMEGFESDKKALQALGKAKLDSGRNIELHRRDLFNNPLDKKELEKYDFAVINPPRAGAEAQIKELARCKKKAPICYISCNPETFARDSRILLDNGYVLKEVTPVDQFYWSPHLELVGRFV